MAEAGMVFFPDEPEAVRFVDVTRGVERAVRPAREGVVLRLASEGDAFVDKPLSNPCAARFRGDEQKTELGHRFRVLHEENRADALTIQLGEPATLALGIERPNEA